MACQPLNEAAPGIAAYAVQPLAVTTAAPEVRTRLVNHGAHRRPTSAAPKSPVAQSAALSLLKSIPGRLPPAADPKSRYRFLSGA
jgi:hypothetical protein